MLKKKICRITFLLVAVILIARIVVVNFQWPAADLIEIPPKESFYMQGLTMSVISSFIATPSEVYEEYDIAEEEKEQLFLEQMIAQGWDAKVLVVALSAVNETNSKITFQAGSLMAECGPWSNGVDHDLFKVANQSTGTIEIEPGQFKNIYLFYDLYDQHFTVTAWKSLDSLPFALSISLYPEKILLYV